MQNGKKKVLALLLAGCCVLSACGTKTDDTKTAEKGNFVTGTVECKEVYVRAKIPGYLTDIPVEEGQEVKEGDLLFSTDRRDVEVKQTQASATAKAAAGQVEAAKNAAEAAAAVVEKANANVKLLETEYAKYQELYAMDAVSQDNMDKLTTQLEAARLDAAAAAAQQQAAQGQYEAATGRLRQQRVFWMKSISIWGRPLSMPPATAPSPWFPPLLGSSSAQAPPSLPSQITATAGSWQMWMNTQSAS